MVGGVSAAASTWQRRAGRGLGRPGGRWWLVSAGPGRTDPSQCWPVCLQPPSCARTYPGKEGWNSQESALVRTNSVSQSAPAAGVGRTMLYHADTIIFSS